MGLPFDKLVNAFKTGVDAQRASDQPVRVSVYVDDTASTLLVSTARDALVPQTTTGLVRVARLDGAEDPRHDTDVAVILTNGSSRLEAACHRLVVAGIPTAIVAEDAEAAPFVVGDPPMLGVIAASDSTVLLDRLARWILDRTDKAPAFAANFPFMRSVAARGIVISASASNAVTGALVLIPGADYPVMTLAQVGMMLKLASMYDKPLRVDRLYDAAGVAVAGLALRSVSRALSSRAGRGAFAVKALVGGCGTAAMGYCLCQLYQRDIDYGPINHIVLRLFEGLRRADEDFALATGSPVATVSNE